MNGSVINLETAGEGTVHSQTNLSVHYVWGPTTQLSFLCSWIGKAQMLEDNLQSLLFGFEEEKGDSWETPQGPSSICLQHLFKKLFFPSLPLHQNRAPSKAKQHCPCSHGCQLCNQRQRQQANGSWVTCVITVLAAWCEVLCGLICSYGNSTWVTLHIHIRLKRGRRVLEE